MSTPQPAQPPKKGELSPLAIIAIAGGSLVALWAVNGIQTREDVFSVIRQGCTGSASMCACREDRVRKETGFADFAMGGRMLDEGTMREVFGQALNLCVQRGYE